MPVNEKREINLFRDVEYRLKKVFTYTGIRSEAKTKGNDQIEVGM